MHHALHILDVPALDHEELGESCLFLEQRIKTSPLLKDVDLFVATLLKYNYDNCGTRWSSCMFCAL